MCSWLEEVMVTSQNSNVIRQVMVTSNNVTSNDVTSSDFTSSSNSSSSKWRNLKSRADGQRH